jgi:CelD/BcsL family acetyltransferase involved in cellulose biosynthesis
MSVVSRESELPALRAEWNAFALAAGASDLMSWETCATWWKHYGRGGELCVMVFRDGEGIAGLLPMHVSRRWLGSVALRTASFLGSDFPFVLDPPLRADRAREVFAQAIRFLVAERRCAAVTFSPLSGAWPHLEALRAAMRDVEDAARVLRDAETGPHTILELPATFDAYLASLSKNQRANWRRGMKQLGEAHDLKADVLTDPAALEAELPKFLQLHKEQWESEGKLGHFGDWPGSEAYHREVVRVHAETGRAHLTRMSVDGVVVSYQLCYAFGPWLHWILPARAVRPDLEKFSLGRLGLVHLIEHAIATGHRRIEEGVGRYDYKVQLGATELGVRSFVVGARGAWASARIRAFLAGGRLLDRLYYRGWFQRVAPKLPFRRRPLWKTWIRSRL